MQIIVAPETAQENFLSETVWRSSETDGTFSEFQQKEMHYLFGETALAQSAFRSLKST